ncbi:FAD-dependent monooxygenase [Verrucomicrobiaceae bacterium 5K15]|uniref:FAD-dependent monooxygenase n=1 Tax=Oceaniferula flava TaxID=2800421 RepID=A0AAE2SF06_9BACT|nr:FAD-dependent monooxygenase [Oceaniferula flavus]MBK1855714.1 FAD-dependent monooxygenase [Oceaniferula flavus]MBM1137021.1 FAD-dependent monooxygenase [Oceaniferula flavus]
MKEIEIIGGGLAGLSLAIYLRKLGVDVTVFESGSYPKHKVCGEFICGVDEAVLQDLGIQEVIDQSQHHTTMKWWMGDSLVLADRLPTVAWGLSRYRLDEDLAHLLVDRGGRLQCGQRVQTEDAESRVWATGKRKKSGRWIGLKIHVTDAQIEGLEMHVGERGYIGLCGIEEGKVNCCGLFRVDKSLRGSGSELIAAYLQANGLLGLAARCRNWQKDEASFSATAGFSFGKQEQVGGLCVGDASYLIPPFTGNGMSMALESSWLAGPWLARYAAGELTWSAACEGYDHECVAFFRKRMSLSGNMQPLLFHRLGRMLLKTAAKTGTLPFQSLFHHLRTP